jgi:hypothetical protein
MTSRSSAMAKRYCNKELRKQVLPTLTYISVNTKTLFRIDALSQANGLTRINSRHFP